MTQEDRLRQLALAQKEVIRAADEAIASQRAVIAQLEQALVACSASADALQASSADCRGTIEKAADLAGAAQQALARGDAAGAAWRLDTLRELLERQGHDLERAEGAAAAAQDHGPEALPPVPLRLLDTPANRRLESALRSTLEAAAEVATERGQPLDESELVVELAARLTEVRLELYGPAGRDG